jgi:hypothetical protein
MMPDVSAASISPTSGGPEMTGAPVAFSSSSVTVTASAAVTPV